jgi:hypothetical protein
MPFVFFFFLVSLLTISWEDRPDVEDHRETDRIFKAAQIQTNAEFYERGERSKQERDSLEKLNHWKPLKKELPHEDDLFSHDD